MYKHTAMDKRAAVYLGTDSGSVLLQYSSDLVDAGRPNKTLGRYVRWARPVRRAWADWFNRTNRKLMSRKFSVFTTDVIYTEIGPGRYLIWQE